jgi:Flp pilus assembly protein TadD
MGDWGAWHWGMGLGWILATGEAVTALGAGLLVAPNETRLHATLGTFLLMQGDAKSAEKRLREALACDARNVSG